MPTGSDEIDALRSVLASGDAAAIRTHLERLRNARGEVALAAALAVAESLGSTEALPLFERAATTLPMHAPAQLNWGVALAQCGRPDEARVRLLEALRLDPDYAEAHYALGNIAKELCDSPEAEASYRAALRLKPGHAGALNNLGLLCLDGSRPEEGAVLLKQHARLEPSNRDAQNNLGLALTALGRFAEAEAAFERALQLDPHSAEVHGNLAGLRKESDRVGEALAGYDLALRYQPEAASIRYNRSLAILKAGDYHRGFAEYEWRWARDKGPPRYFASPRWRGESLAGKSILLWCEQGLGDAIQFVRFAPQLAAAGAKVHLECPPPLVELFRSLPGLESCFAEGLPQPAVDFQCPLMSLPNALGLSLDAIPNAPYLRADPARVETWRKYFERFPGRKIGLAWRGNPRHKWDRFRSRSLEFVAALAAEPGTQLFSLQQGPGREELARRSEEPSVIEPPQDSETAPRPFAETAAILTCLDGVVTVDTAVAHLAGAMGLPTRVLLGRMTDWRWLVGRTDSPWYSSVRLERLGENSEI